MLGYYFVNVTTCFYFFAECTYVKHADYDLNCGTKGTIAAPVADCITLCSDDVECLAMSYHTGIMMCKLRTCTQLTNPESWGYYSKYQWI